MRRKHLQFDKKVMSIWECCELLNDCVDDSDPDLEEPQIEHLLQTAEAIRLDHPHDDWFHLTGLIHGMVWYAMQCNAVRKPHSLYSHMHIARLLLKSLLMVSDMAIDPSTHLMSVSSVGDLTFLEPYDITTPNYSHRRCGPPNVQIWAKFCCIQHSERNPSMQLWVRPSA